MIKKKIYEHTKSERGEVQANNIRAIKDAWYKLLLSFHQRKRLGVAEVHGIQDELPGTDHHYSLDFEVRDFNPKGNINTELAILSLRCRYKDVSGRLQFPSLATLEISGSPDEEGRIGLDIRHTRTEPGHEGRGYGQALMSLVNEAVPLLMKLFEAQWKDKIVYVIQTDMASPADRRAKTIGITRKGWTTNQARQLGFTDNTEYIKKYLGEDFLPLPQNTLVRVYNHPQL